MVARLMALAQLVGLALALRVPPARVPAAHMFESAVHDWGGHYARELALAHEAAQQASALLLESPGHVQGHVQDALRDCVVLASSPTPHRWLCHADEKTIVVSLISPDDNTAVMTYVHRPAERETAYATLDGGTYVMRGEDSEPEAATLGEASMSAQVLHCPTGWDDSLDTLVQHLRETGTGMPVEIVRKGADATSCDGLLDVVLGRADVHVAPPGRFLPQQFPPPQVLCAFELLLTEAGGCLSDVYGQPIDAIGAIDGGGADDVHGRGVLACVEVSHNYLLRSMAVAFPPYSPAIPVDLTGLSEKLKGFSVEFEDE